MRLRIDTGQSAQRIRMLFFLRERFPTHRVDVDALYGRELCERGHEIDFVMQAASSTVPTGPQPWHGRTVWVGATDDGRRFGGRLRKHWLGFLHDIQMLWRADLCRYDAIQVKDKFLVALLAIAKARRHGKKFFFWLSFPVPEAQLMRARDGTARYPVFAWVRGQATRHMLYRWIIPCSDHVFVQSQRMKHDLNERAGDPRRTTAVPMGIEMVDVPRSPTAAISRQSSCRTIAYLGTLAAERRIDVLVEMLQLLIQGGTAARLLLIGDGDSPRDRSNLEELADRLGVRDSLEITGFLPRAEALSRLRCAEVAISPYFPTPILLSTSPTKLVEYLALGLPVVANDHPEQRYVLQQSRAGVRVPWGARHFARGVLWLLERPVEERQAMAERGRAWVIENRAYNRIADSLQGTYIRLLVGPAAPAGGQPDLKDSSD